MANMPGYKSRNTHIWLEEAAMTLDFVLDPEVILKGNLPRSGCECDCGYTSRLEFVDFLWGSHLGVFVILIVAVGFLYLLLLRRRNTNFSKHRQLGGQKIAGGV
jgi:carboxypeptidase D